MVFRRILKWPTNSLRKKSRDFSFEEDQKVLEDLLDTFNVSGGYGLSAPQIGENVNVIVINEKALTEDEDKPEVKLMINPKVVSGESKRNFKEACFSLPGMEVEVERFDPVAVSWQDREGKQFEQEFSGYISACLQHEIDHLAGVLAIDRLSHLRRSILIRRYKKKIKKSKKEKL